MKSDEFKSKEMQIQGSLCGPSRTSPFYIIGINIFEVLKESRIA